MRRFVMHVHDTGGDDPREEAYVVVPGVERTVFPVPIDLLGEALAMFDEALEDAAEQRCERCGAALADPADAAQSGGGG